MEKKSLYLAVPTCLAVGVGLIGTASAQADSGAQGAAQGSPGIVSGNLAQLPLHVPANVCGNTVDVVGLLNPVFGNQCPNAGAPSRAPSDEEGREGAADASEPQGESQGSPERPGRPSDHEDRPQGPEGQPDRHDGHDLGKPQQNGNMRSSHAPSGATSPTGSADRDKVSREQRQEADRLGMRSPEDTKSVGLTPVGSSERVTAPKGSSGPARAAESAAPRSQALAETGTDDGLGLAALTALGLCGAGALMIRRTRSSRH